MHGKGEFTWPDGKKYIGNLKKNQKIIKHIFIGDYIEDKKEGFGEFYWQDGKIYKGYWKDGK